MDNLVNLKRPWFYSGRPSSLTSDVLRKLNTQMNSINNVRIRSMIGSENLNLLKFANTKRSNYLFSLTSQNKFQNGTIFR